MCMWILIQSSCCCCCDSPATLLLSSVVQVEEVHDRSRVDPQVLHCELCRMALWQLKRCSTDCGATPHSGQTSDMPLAMWASNCSKADSDQNATGQVWCGSTEVADFQEVRYQVVKLQGLCLVQNSVLHLRLLDCGEYVGSRGIYNVV